jgi:hypothetical protein
LLTAVRVAESFEEAPRLAFDPFRAHYHHEWSATGRGRSLHERTEDETMPIAPSNRSYSRIDS